MSVCVCVYTRVCLNLNNFLLNLELELHEKHVMRIWGSVFISVSQFSLYLHLSDLSISSSFCPSFVPSVSSWGILLSYRNDSAFFIQQVYFLLNFLWENIVHSTYFCCCTHSISCKLINVYLWLQLPLKGTKERREIKTSQDIHCFSNSFVFNSTEVVQILPTPSFLFGMFVFVCIPPLSLLVGVLFICFLSAITFRFAMKILT